MAGISKMCIRDRDWIGLLTHFAEKVKKDQFAYRYYENKASEADNTTEKLPLVASYIAVSYTHLDVYKRQDRDSVYFCGRYFVKAGSRRKNQSR